MTEEERDALESLMQYAWDRWRDVEAPRQEDAGHAQTYALCMIALQLDRIAKMLKDEHPF